MLLFQCSIILMETVNDNLSNMDENGEQQLSRVIDYDLMKRCNIDTFQCILEKFDCIIDVRQNEEISNLYS